MIERRTIEDREQWLEWRKSDVTASDLGALFGLSPFKSRLQLWAEKTGQAAQSRETPAMRRGRWLEPAVIAALADRMPNANIEAPLNIYIRDPDKRLGATPDATADWRVVECKVTSRPVFDAWQGECPMAYQLQALANAMLLDTQGALVAVLVIDTYDAQLEVFHVERHPEAEAKIVEAVAQFWQDIDEGKQPPADYALDGELLARLYRPRETIEPVDLSSDNLLPEVLAEREALMAEIKAKESRVDAIKAEVIDKLRGAPAGVCGDWKIAHKLIHRRETIIPAGDSLRLTISRKRREAA